MSPSLRSPIRKLLVAVAGLIIASAFALFGAMLWPGIELRMQQREFDRELWMRSDGQAQKDIRAEMLDDVERFLAGSPTRQEVQARLGPPNRSDATSDAWDLGRQRSIIAIDVITLRVHFDGAGYRGHEVRER